MIACQCAISNATGDWVYNKTTSIEDFRTNDYGYVYVNTEENSLLNFATYLIVRFLSVILKTCFAVVVCMILRIKIVQRLNKLAATVKQSIRNFFLNLIHDAVRQ